VPLTPLKKKAPGCVGLNVVKDYLRSQNTVFFFLEGLDEVELNLLLFYFFLVAYSIENRISVFL
jgi:hypothetical protein